MQTHLIASVGLRKVTTLCRKSGRVVAGGGGRYEARQGNRPGFFCVPARYFAEAVDPCPKCAAKAARPA